MPRRKPKKHNNGIIVETQTPSHPDVHQFNHAQYWGYGLIFFIYTVAEYAQEWESLKYFWHPSLEPNKVLFILRAFLFIELIILIGRWFIATINELDMWSSSELNWSHWSNSPISKQNAYAAVLGLGVLLGLLLAFSNKILVAASILSVFSLFGYWTQWLSNNYFDRALKDTSVKNEKHRKRLAILKHYWLNQPQLARITTFMFFALVSVSLATAASFKSEQKHLFEVSAYALLDLISLFVK